MSPTSIKDGRLLYHQTELKNLQSILETGLLSRAMPHLKTCHLEM